jgi:error-prone DNA polymerase
MQKVETNLRAAMERRGVKPEVIEQIARAIGSFSNYGFPESHAISFALLAYASAYLKAHHPLEFYAGLLNNQPMGFYSPATLIKDAKRHGVRFKPVCVLRSDWRCAIEEDGPNPTTAASPSLLNGERAGVRGEAVRLAFPSDPVSGRSGSTGISFPGVGSLSCSPLTPALSPLRGEGDSPCCAASIRLGLCLVSGLSQEHAQQLLEERACHPFSSLEDLRARVPLSKDELRTLAEIGALNGFAAHRREALWQVEKALRRGDLFAEPDSEATPSPLNGERAGVRGENIHDGSTANTCPPPALTAPANERSPLAPMTPPERLRADYGGTGVTLGPHPMALIRPQLKNIWRAADLPRARHGQIVRIAGNVICRQRPGTAKGFVFVSLEDETGISNAIVAPALFEKLRLVITQEPFLLITGRLQNVDNVAHVRARHITRLTQEPIVGGHSHDFH